MAVIAGNSVGFDVSQRWRVQAAGNAWGMMVGVAGAAFQQDVRFIFGGGDPAITIAVLDGPVDRTHDCFRGARLTPLDTVASRGTDGPATAQGTHIASVIFGQACSTVEGLAPLCRGLIIPIFSDDRLGCAQLELAQAITLALQNGAQVIHISTGFFDRARQTRPELIDVIAQCNARGVLIVAAAGRDSCIGLLRACGADNILPVVAIGKEGQPVAGFNGCGPQDDGLMVPGSHVIGAALEGGVARRSGGSFAAALVSGVVGMLLGWQVKNGQAPDPHAVREALLQSAAPRTPTWAHECRLMMTGRDNVAAAAWRLAELVGRHAGDNVRPLDRWGVSLIGSRSRTAGPT